MLSAERLLVLVLEDVHWSDASTIDLLNLVARRRERARLLVVATYRPAEVIIHEHPLKRVKQEVVTRGQGVEIVVGGLEMESVQRYVQQRWAAGARILRLRQWCIGARKGIRCSWCSWLTIWRSKT